MNFFKLDPGKVGTNLSLEEVKKRIAGDKTYVIMNLAENGGMDINIQCPPAFLSEGIAQLLMLSEGTIINDLLYRYGLKLDSDKHLSNDDRLHRMLYSYDLAKELFKNDLKKLSKENEELKALVSRQKITIDNLTAAISALKSKEAEA